MIELFVTEHGRIYEILPSAWTITGDGRLLRHGPYEVWSGPAEKDDNITFFNEHYLGQIRYIPKGWVYIGEL